MAEAYNKSGRWRSLEATDCSVWLLSSPPTSLRSHCNFVGGRARQADTIEALQDTKPRPPIIARRQPLNRNQSPTSAAGVARKIFRRRKLGCDHKKQEACSSSARCRSKVQWLSIPYSTFISFYRAMHFSAFARSCDRMSSVRLSVRLSVRPSVTLVICDHIDWKSWKLIAWAISPTSSLFAAKRRSTYSQGNMEKFWGD